MSEEKVSHKNLVVDIDELLNCNDPNCQLCEERKRLQPFVDLVAKINKMKAIGEDVTAEEESLDRLLAFISQSCGMLQKLEE